MTHCQPFLHKLFAALGVDADAHWIAGRCGVLAEDLHHLMEQSAEFNYQIVPSDLHHLMEQSDS